MKNIQETDTLEQRLDEDIIKKVALRFLRHHYKFRLRHEDQPIVAKYDLEGVGGIVADGYFSYKKPDGKPFTATFEATAKESKDEVSFKPQLNLLIWDGLAFAMIVLVVLSALNLHYGFHKLDNSQYVERLAMILVTIGFGMATFGIFAQKFRRYRYIYAIEQFKKYFADEQWIALGADVFETPTDPHFTELKRQCVHNGFGLVLVDKNLDSRILITPSRQDIFVGKRKKIDFQSPSKIQQIEHQKEFGLAFGLFGKNLPNFLKRDRSVLRYRRSFHNQIMVTTCCTVLLGVVYVKEMENPDFQVVDKQRFVQAVEETKDSLKRNSDKYLPDSAAASPKKLKKQPQQNSRFWEIEPPKRSIAENMAPATDELTEKGGMSMFLYDCARFYNFEGKKYIVETGEYSDWVLAKAQVEKLRGKQIESAALLKSCFTSNGKGFIVYAGLFCNTADEAANQIENWSKNGLTTTQAAENWKIRAIEPIIK